MYKPRIPVTEKCISVIKLDLKKPLCWKGSLLSFCSQWDVAAYTVIHAHWAQSVHKCLQDQYQIITFLFKRSLYNLQEDSDQLYISWLIILIKLTGSTLVIQTENKIFRLYILLLHTSVKSLMYLMMFYLSQPKGKSTLSLPPAP